jgi:hypothetical protein
MAQLGHTLTESRWYVGDCNGTEIDMLEEASSSCWQIYLKTDVSIDTVPIFIVFYFVEPDVAGFDSVKDGVSNFSSGVEPSFFCKVDASFNPGSLGTRKLHELKDIAVTDIKVANDSAILVRATSSKCFI